VAVLVAVATALVGPITFLGLLVANLARQLLGTHRHAWAIPGAGLLAVIALVGGQLVLEQVLGFNSSLSIVINFVGGIVFIALLTREPRL
jgi:iron complex transport system permease protein